MDASSDPTGEQPELHPTADGASVPFPVVPTEPVPPECVGRFEVRRFLGEGAFGRVFEAFDPSLKRVVALKVAKPEQVASPRRVKRFLREAQAAAGLAHPNIVTVFDSGQD